MASEIGFCPFCRESFEGERVCPDHDLVLVPFDALPQSRGEDAPAEDEPVAPYDPRLGRGILFAGVVVALIGFLLPFATTAMDGESLTLTGFELASRRPLLWAVPFVCAALVFVLALRRTPREMRGTRLAVPLLTLLAGASVGFGVFIVQRFAEQRRVAWGLDVRVALEPGVWVMIAGLVLATIGGLRLGVVRRRAALPHGATVEDERERIVVRDD